MTGAPRVAQVANFLTPTSGGLRVVVDALAHAVLDDGGHRLRLTPGPATTEHTGRHDRTVTIAGPRLPASNRRYHLLLNRGTARRELAAFAPDLIEVHDQTTLAWTGRWARRHGVPSILIAHERLDHLVARVTGLPPAALEPHLRRWVARLAERFDAIVCASDFAAEPFRDAGAAGVHRIPFGVDLQTFTPHPRVGGPPWQAHALRLIFAGRLSSEKEPDTALDVLARLRHHGIPTHLVMLGHGPLASSLHTRAQRERLPVTFLGHIPERRRIAQLLASADIAIAPSRCETFGLSVLEALACGTPVVASDAGAARELLVPGVGIAAPTTEGLADAVRTLVARPCSGPRARVHAEQYSWPRACAIFADLRTELIRSHPGSGQVEGGSVRRMPSGASTTSLFAGPVGLAGVGAVPPEGGLG